MDTTMDIDELKSAWQTLDHRLDQQHRLNLQIFTESRLGKARSRLRPLFWGQILQIAFGILMILLGVNAWRDNLAVPELLVSGIIVHVYGIVLIACAGTVLSKISGIDQAAPVTEIQKRLSHLRSFYVRTGTAIGLSWWLVWIPLAGAFFYWLAGVNVIGSQPTLAAWAVTIGVIGLLASVWLHRWASNPRRPRLARFVSDNLTGSSLRNARAEIDEIERFERD